VGSLTEFTKEGAMTTDRRTIGLMRENARNVCRILARHLLHRIRLLVRLCRQVSSRNNVCRFRLRSSIALSVASNRITPLYQHLVHPSHPRSLFFVGVPATVVPFPLFDLQARVAVQLLAGKAPLPGESPRDGLR